jgi:hypothetical protein
MIRVIGSQDISTRRLFVVKEVPVRTFRLPLLRSTSPPSVYGLPTIPLNYARHQVRAANAGLVHTSTPLRRLRPCTSCQSP